MARKAQKPTEEKKESKKSLEDLLIKNNVILQAKLTELLVSLNKVSTHLNKLVEIFEKAGEEVKGEKVPVTVDKKLETLEEQNKAIADAILALEGHLRRPGRGPMPPPPREEFAPRREEFAPRSLPKKI